MLLEPDVGVDDEEKITMDTDRVVMRYFSFWGYIDCLMSERCLVERKENDQV